MFSTGKTQVVDYVQQIFFLKIDINLIIIIKVWCNSREKKYRINYNCK